MKKEIDYYLIGGLPGFSQDWFPVGWMRLGGCAAVTACDASIMLARDEGLTALCPCDPSHVTRQSYLDFADVMRPYLHPRWGGIDTLKIYIDGFGQYICDVGADEAISLSGVEGNEPWEKARDAIREQIDRGRVVPFLTLYHQNRKFAEYEWHWYNIAGYWNFCDQYFNSQTAAGVSAPGIHNIVDEGLGKSADYVEEANLMANYYHALYQLKYFGPEGYDVLDDAEQAWYQSVIDAQGVMTGIGERPVGTR